MRKFLFVFLFVPFFALAESDGLATYSIRLAIDGMQLPNVPPGSGDKSIEFRVNFPADDAETAETLWYKHLSALFGEEDQESLRALLDEFSRTRR